MCEWRAYALATKAASLGLFVLALRFCRYHEGLSYSDEAPGPGFGQVPAAERLTLASA